MATSDPQLGINSWFEDELREQYQHDKTLVDESWKKLFDTNGNPVSAVATKTVAPSNNVPSASSVPPSAPAASDEAVVMRGAAANIAKNMTESLAIPLATSQRTIPVKVIDENRQLLNHHRGLTGKSKISYTHLIGWALIQAIKDVPAINHAFSGTLAEPLRL